MGMSGRPAPAFGAGVPPERTLMDEETSVARQWCQVCQVAHLPLWREGCDPLKAPITSATKPKPQKAVTRAP
jgi:hypothetical protein